MMRAIALCAMVLAGSTFAPCQNTFIVQMDTVQAGYDASGRSIMETDSGYVLFGMQRSDDGTDRYRCAVYDLDPYGAYQSRYEVGSGDPTGSYFGLFDPVSRTADGGFASAINHSNGYGYAIDIVRFDAQGEMGASTNIMFSTPNDSIVVGTRQMRQTSDGGFVFCGFRDPPDSYAKAILVKLDSTGALQWEQDYTTAGQAYEAISVAQYTDGGYVLAGYRLPGNLNGLGFVIRTDSAGNELWRRHFGGHSGGWGAVRVASDGGIITFSSYSETDWPWDWRQYLLTKWDASGNIVWQMRSHYFFQVTAYDLEILPDQSIVTVGTYSWLSELAKYSAEGDSLWSRHLNVFNNLGNHLTYDVEPTTDGGFVLTGEAFQTLEDPHPNQETIFVIKTDSLGCVVPGCQNTGVQEYVMDLQNLLHVSPNPASDIVQVSLDLPECGEVLGTPRIQLLDVQGRLVLEQTIQQNLNQLRATLDVSTLPAGIYYLHLRDAKRWLAGSTVIVE